MTNVTNTTNCGELVIDETNFHQYFFDVKKHRPKKDQVLACYNTLAELTNGPLKKDVVHLLQTKENGAELSVRLMQKIGNATYKSALATVNEINADLLKGLSDAEILEKPYEFHLQQYFYTEKQYIPDNDKRWFSMSLINVEEIGSGSLEDFNKSH